MLASTNGHVEVVTLLLAAHADIHAVDIVSGIIVYLVSIAV